MLIYWLLLAFPAIMAMVYPVSVTGATRAPLRMGQILALTTFVTLYTLLGTFRFETGGDWLTYDLMFEDMRSDTLSYALTATDPLYGFLNWFSAQLGTGIYLVNGVCCLVLVYGVVRVATSFREPWLAVLIVVPYLLIVVGFGYVRQGAAIGIMLLAIASMDRSNPIRTVVYLAISVAFHSTAALTIPLFVFGMAPRNKLLATVIGMVGAAAFVLVLAPRLQSFELGYIDAEYDSTGTAARLVMSVVPSALIVLRWRQFLVGAKARPVWLMIAIANFLAVVALVLSPSSTAVDRIALFFSVIQMAAFGEFRALIGVSDRTAQLVRLALIAVAIAVQSVWLIFGTHAIFWVPYQSLFESLTMSGPIAVCANQAWNLVNFRAGLIRALIDRGFQVVAVAPPDPAMERKLAEMGCAFEPVTIDAAGLSPLRDFATFLAFRRAIAKHRPAAWLSWTIKPNVYGSLAARLAGVPAFPNVSGLGTAFIQRNLLTEIVKRLYTAGFTRAHRVFFQNTDDRDLFVSLGIVRAGQSALLPGSGIDAAHWAPADDSRAGPNRFLMIARVVADKGVREYAEAAKVVRSRFPDARFALMGPLDVANRTAVSRDEVAGWQADGAIEYMPPSDDVRDAVNAADWIVLPSYREGLSRVLLEAAAMARPIVTTDVPGCRDVVTDGLNGFLCKARDAASLAAALERAAACNDAEWHAMGLAGRTRVQSEFSQERVTGLYLEALESAGIVPSISA